MRSVIPFGLILSAFAVSAASAQPVPIEGIAHVGFRTGDLEKARAYYTDMLGFQQAFELKTKDGGIASAFFKVNDDQYVEISPGLPPEEKIRLTHVAFETTDIEALRRILQSRGLNPPPVGRSGGGDLTFSLEDPDHQRIEFVQYQRGSMVSDARGKYVDSRRLSDHLQHVGITVPKEKLAEAYHLYHDQLGFAEFWRLGPTPDDPQLIKLLVPGKRHDIVELMIYANPPSRAEYGSMQHINLEVPEITAPYFTLLDRGASPSHLKPEVNAENIWGMNVFDPDGTRTEIQDIRKVPNLPIAVVGLVHGHVAGFFNRYLHRYDAHIVGIAEPDEQLRAKYAAQYKLDASLFFSNLNEMLDKTKPRAVVVFSNTFDHLRVVEACASRHIDVMMEKPLAISLEQAHAMQRAGRRGNIHVLVNYETTWYPSNHAAWSLVHDKAIGDIRKMVAHDGHQGPKEIGVPPEFFAWLTNPALNGAGALFDFGCYGADLMTWLMNGESPVSVTAVTQRIKPEIYPRVDDEATIILTYPRAQGIIQASWNWPFDRKDLEVYGKTGYVKTIRGGAIDERLPGKDEERIAVRPLEPRRDDSMSYLTAVERGEIKPEGLSSLATNVVVMEILDAARRSAATGQTIRLAAPSK